MRLPRSGCQPGCSTDADQWEFNGKINPKDRMVISGGNEVSERILPVTMGDIVDNEIFNVN